VLGVSCGLCLGRLSGLLAGLCCLLPGRRRSGFHYALRLMRVEAPRMKTGRIHGWK